ncbi:hypothetical protein O3G_MSEX006858 [Manduca sexta]|uniref:Uncharacterized protein n=1 Tax=Manduca sexta TaxID=7130 RepID=A0A922CL40_MANSE|nr:hypothetical protein O3G_MSEX006858 [Manduca sexta]
MLWYRRQLSKLLRIAALLLFYLTVYFVISFAIAPEVTVSFINEDIRVGDKYVLMYLVAPKTAPFTDAEGAEVFDPACGKCYITNNRGFLPLKEYDAVLSLEDRRLSAESFGEKNYIIETTRGCIRNKLKGCVREPRIRSAEETFNLCGLCKHLHAMRERKV